MADPIGSFLGPGSQPADEDGATLDYVKMPSEMMTFSLGHLPEADATEGLGAAKLALEQVLSILKAYGGDGEANRVDLSRLDKANLELINQVLGEGEVSVIGGANVQAQESVLAGVWRLRETDDSGAVVGDFVEVASFPTSILGRAFDGAQPAVQVPERFGENIFNAPPLLPEINEHIPQVGPGRPPHVINLSLLPHTEEDLGFLNDILGRGPVTILSRGYGNCRIIATATKDVWWVQFFNSQDTMILNTIEIVSVPEVACAAHEDIADSAERLDEILEIYR